MMSADCLVLLSDIDGLYTAPPGSGVAARRLDEVRHITPEIEAMAGSAGTELSRGGMVTKIEAGRIALASGTNMVITSGKVMHPLRALDAGRGLHLVPGAVRSGDGAQALDRGPARAQGRRADRCRGRKGAAVRQEPAAGRRAARGRRIRARRLPSIIRAADGRELGRGLVAYARGDAARIIGKKSGEIAAILGHAGRSELVHRDDMVLSKA